MKLSIKKKIMLLTIAPAGLIAAILAVVSVLVLGRSIIDDTQKQLALAANAIHTESSMVTSQEEIEKLVDGFKDENDIDVIIYDLRTPVISSFEDYTDKMDAQIFNVIKKNETYFHTNVKINGESYITYFLPLMENGECVGAIVAAEPLLYLNQMVAGIIGRIVFFTVLITTISFIVASIAIKAMVRRLDNVNSVITNLAENNLAVEYTKYASEKDQIETIFNHGVELSNQLNGIMTNTKDVANKLNDVAKLLRESTEITTNASTEIAKAVEDVANGASSQAEETTNATQKISNMAGQLEAIENAVGKMDEAATSMNNAKEIAVSSISALQNANEAIAVDIESTNEQVEITSNSVKEIQKAVDGIKGIANQTKLLALNANIEAARVGDAGKGFAVVASSIGELAAESSELSDTIDSILKNLTQNYALIEDNMKSTTENAELQNQKILETHEVVGTLEDNINNAVQQIEHVYTMVGEINTGIKEMVDIISNLSAISEENAASTEETMASVEEMNASIHQIMEKAQVVENSANLLMKEVEVFKTN